MNITLMKKDLETKKAEVKALMTAQMTAAESEKRERTAEEIGAVDAKLAECKDLQARIERAQGQANQTAEIERLTAGMNTETTTTHDQVQPERRSMGQQFVENPDYRRFIRESGHRRSGSWISPTVELQATTLDTTSGSGGPLVLPQVLPGIQPLFFRRLTIGDLLPQGTTDSNALIFLQEKTFTNAAAAVAEGAAKPESTLVFQQATSPVQKLAHWLPVTEEMLEDYSAIRAYIDARLRLGLDLTEEDELLNGSGIAPHLTGLMTVAGMTATQATGGDSNADAIMKEITKITTTAFIQPDGIVMNPANWQSVQLAKNANGQYFGAGPWAPPQPPTLWGLPVAVTPAIVAATALVGAFRMCAQEFTKGAVRVEVSNSHSDFFVKNLIAIRAEERLALCIYRPAGFGKVTGLS
jgi:HK97 family phage major capsid protein